jgi:hypothetical protein
VGPRPLAQHVPPLQGAFDAKGQLRDAVGLDDIVAGSFLHGLDCRGSVVSRGQHQYREVGVFLVHALEQLDPVWLWHANVQDDQIEGSGTQEVHHLRAVGGRVDPVPLKRELIRYNVHDPGIVVHNQDVLRSRWFVCQLFPPSDPFGAKAQL